MHTRDPSSVEEQSRSMYSFSFVKYLPGNGRSAEKKCMQYKNSVWTIFQLESYTQIYFFVLNTSFSCDAIRKRSHKEQRKHGTPNERLVHLQKQVWSAVIGDVKLSIQPV